MKEGFKTINSFDFEAETYSKFLSEIGESIDIDFSHYKKSIIEEAIKKRIKSFEFESNIDYFNYLKSNKDEIKRFLENITVNYSYFFRNKEIFDLIANYIKKTYNRKNLKVWSCPCASGEEPYSLAILIEKIKEKGSSIANYQVIGSDISNNAITRAKKGIYDIYSLEETSERNMEKYFRKISNSPEKYIIIDSIKENVDFIQEDIIKNHKKNIKYDIIFCRNFFIYLNQKSRKDLLKRLACHLKTHGILVLGRTEKIGKNNSIFESIDLKNRIYCKRPNDRKKIISSAFLSKRKQKKETQEESLNSKTSSQSKIEIDKKIENEFIKRQSKRKSLQSNQVNTKNEFIEKSNEKENNEKNEIKKIKPIKRKSFPEKEETYYQRVNEDIIESHLSNINLRKNKLINKEEKMNYNLQYKPMKEVKRQLEIERYKIIREKVKYKKKKIMFERQKLDFERKMKDFEKILMKIEKDKRRLKHEKFKLAKERAQFNKIKKLFFEQNNLKSKKDENGKRIKKSDPEKTKICDQ